MDVFNYFELFTRGIIKMTLWKERWCRLSELSFILFWNRIYLFLDRRPSSHFGICWAQTRCQVCYVLTICYYFKQFSELDQSKYRVTVHLHRTDIRTWTYGSVNTGGYVNSVEYCFVCELAPTNYHYIHHCRKKTYTVKRIAV